MGTDMKPTPRKPFVLTLIVLLFCLLTFLPAVASAQTLTVGVEDLGYRPYFYSENGQYKGAAREILDAFAQKAGLELKYEILPVKRLYKGFLGGTLDFKFPDNPNWKSKEKEGLPICYSQPMLEFTDGVIVRPENLGRGLDALKVLGTVLGFTAWGYLDLVDSGKIRLLENASFSGLLEQTIEGRVDGAYINRAVADYQLNNVLRQPEALVFDPGLPHVEDGYRISSTKHPDLIKRFDQFLLDEADRVRTIKSRHNLAF